MLIKLFKQNYANHMIECATDIFPYLTIGEFYKIERIITFNDNDGFIYIKDDDGYKFAIPYQKDVVQNKFFHLVKINNKR